MVERVDNKLDGVAWVSVNKFFYIPVHLRIVAANICSVGWNCFLSYLYNGKAHGDHQKEEILDHLVDPDEEIEETTMVVY